MADNENVLKEKKIAGGGLVGRVLDNEHKKANNDLMERLPEFFDRDGNFKRDKFDDEIKTNNVSEIRDGYKLGFIGKDYARLQAGKASETMIVPDNKHNKEIENTNSQNIFITGDNLEALRHLVNAYQNQVKLIYIDPPYNTGKEFVYSDKFELSDEQLKNLDYSDNDILRLKSIQGKSSHSAWLTFMYPRLKIAQKLLSDDGVIFVSIDDNEQANLKLLMDDVFGEDNFIACLVRRTQTGINNKANYFSPTKDYIYIYAGQRNKLIYFRLKDEVKLSDYSLIENEDKEFYGKKYKRGESIYKTGLIGERPNGVFGILCPDGSMAFPPKNKHFKWSKERFQSEYNPQKGIFRMMFIETQNSNLIDEQGIQSKWNIYEKNYAPQENFLDKVQGDLLLKTNFTNGQATNTLEEMEIPFDYSKPKDLISYLVKIIDDNKNMIVLDFFAGSATTAHAVMQLNAEDGGKRKFIMVQLDEPTNPDSEAKKAGYNTIDEIARERIKRAAKKIKEENAKTLSKDFDFGFKHYRLANPPIETINKIIEFNPEKELLSEDMIKPFENKTMQASGLDTLLTTWLIDDGYRFDTKVENVKFGNYQAQYVKESQTAYLINQGWDTEALKDLLNKIGKNEIQISTIIIYPYSFGFEVLRELKTNIKTNLDNTTAIIERY